MRHTTTSMLYMALVAAPATAVMLSSAVDMRTEAAGRVAAKFGFLVGSLDEFLESMGVPPLLRPQAGHARLLQEVQRLDDEGDALGALLLRDFARQMPLAELFPPGWDAAPGVAETVSIEADGHGNLVKTIMRCENGNCTNTSGILSTSAPELGTAVNGSAVLGDFGEAVRSLTSDLKVNGSAVLEDFGEAVRSFTSDLKGIFGKAGIGGLQDALKGILGTAPAGEAGAQAGPLQEMPRDFGNKLGGVLGKLFGDMFREGQAANSTVRNVSSRVSSSTTTRVENGKVIQETVRCENGRCIKETIEEDLPGAAAPAATSI